MIKTRVNLVNPNYKTDYLENLLKFRGVEDIQQYLYPSDELLNPPTHLDNIDEGYHLLTRVAWAGNPILLIVDADVDGYTSSAIMYQYIKQLNEDVEVHYLIHERKAHGLSDCIDEVLQSDIHYGLVICPDSSSNDFEQHEQLKEIGTPVLVLDHHLVDREISTNTVLINNQSSVHYTNKELTGAGVVWQFCRYCDEQLGANYAWTYTDLAALGICSDMGSALTMENRFIFDYGFNRLENEFFRTLVEKQSYSMGGEVSYMSVAFYITPMLNALIRVGTMEEKTRLFQSFIVPDTLVPSGKRGEKGVLVKVCSESARECTNARARQNKMCEQAMDELEVKIFKYDLLEDKILIIKLDEDNDFPADLNGLLAMKLSKKFKRPTLVLRECPDGVLKGSGRGLDNCALTSLKDFLSDSEITEYAQGHAQAFGCGIKEDKLSTFVHYADDKLQDIDFGEGVYDVNFSRVAMDDDLSSLIEDLSRYKEIWGQKNKTPLIYVSDINIHKKDIQVMGRNKDTIKIVKNGIAYMKFFAKDLIEELESYPQDLKINVVGEPNLNFWGGNVTPQIFCQAIELLADDGF